MVCKVPEGPWVSPNVHKQAGDPPAGTPTPPLSEGDARAYKLGFPKASLWDIALDRLRGRKFLKRGSK